VWSDVGILEKYRLSGITKGECVGRTKCWPRKGRKNKDADGKERGENREI
jgi:hypothetical protein